MTSLADTAAIKRGDTILRVVRLGGARKLSRARGPIRAVIARIARTGHIRSGVHAIRASGAKNARGDIGATGDRIVLPDRATLGKGSRLRAKVTGWARVLQEIGLVGHARRAVSTRFARTSEHHVLRGRVAVAIVTSLAQRAFRRAPVRELTDTAIDGGHGARRALITRGAPNTSGEGRTDDTTLKGGIVGVTASGARQRVGRSKRAVATLGAWDALRNKEKVGRITIGTSRARVGSRERGAGRAVVASLARASNSGRASSAVRTSSTGRAFCGSLQCGVRAVRAFRARVVSRGGCLLRAVVTSCAGNTGIDIYTRTGGAGITLRAVLTLRRGSQIGEAREGTGRARILGLIRGLRRTVITFEAGQVGLRKTDRGAHFTGRASLARGNRNTTSQRVEVTSLAERGHGGTCRAVGTNRAIDTLGSIRETSGRGVRATRARTSGPVGCAFRAEVTRGAGQRGVGGTRRAVSTLGAKNAVGGSRLTELVVVRAKRCTARILGSRHGSLGAVVTHWADIL